MERSGNKRNVICRNVRPFKVASECVLVYSVIRNDYAPKLNSFISDPEGNESKVGRVREEWLSEKKLAS